MSNTHQPQTVEPKHKSQLEAKLASAEQGHDTVLVDMLKQQLAELEDPVAGRKLTH